ncbi:unnamed protein product, partial [Allacma fusca]
LVSSTTTLAVTKTLEALTAAGPQVVALSTVNPPGSLL